MAGQPTPGDPPPRGMIDPALHPLPQGYRAPAEEPVVDDVAPEPAQLFGGAPTGPGFRHAESPLTPTELDDDVRPQDDTRPLDDGEAEPLDELDLLEDDPARPSRIAATVRGRPLQAAVLLLAVLVMVGGVGLGALLFRDARQTYTADEVLSALKGFRAPTGRTQVTAGNGLAAQLSVSPQVCASLVTQSPPDATDGAQWTSTDGTGYEQVQVRATRFADPATARAVLRALIDSTSDCERVLITWQDASPRWVRVRSATSSTGVLSAREELSYGLRSSYGGLVYVRQHGNVVAFVSGIGEVDSGRALSDDLVAELQSLSTS